MMSSVAGDPAAMAAALARAAGAGEAEFLAALEQVPAAAYRTDRDGLVTHYNRACVPFAGRRPVPHRDRWCVTWKLYTEAGALLPHDQCPMAVALRENREVRGARAVAERPDGRRLPFVPYPTPLRDERGELVGAINLLIDVSDPDREALGLEENGRYRRLAALVEGALPPANVAGMRQFRAIFGPLDPVGFDTLSFEAPDVSEALETLAALGSQRPFQLWCDGSYYGRFQRVVEDGTTYWRLIAEFSSGRIHRRATPPRPRRPYRQRQR